MHGGDAMRDLFPPFAFRIPAGLGYIERVLHHMIQTLEYAAYHIVPRNHDDTFRHWQNHPVMELPGYTPREHWHGIRGAAVSGRSATTSFFSE
jgi:hypothetical protein